MIEIVFGESACGSLKIAQTYGKGKYRGSAVSIFMRHEDGSVPSSDEMKKAQLQAQEQERIAWENAIPLGGKSSDVYCFDMALSVGDISDNGIGEQRKNVFKKMLSVCFVEDLDYQVEEKIQKIKTTLTSVIERYVAGEEIRIWYSYNPDELCGMYWLMKQLQPLNCQTTIYLVKLPTWEYGKENTMTSKIAWGEVSPGEWGNYITLQEKANLLRRREEQVQQGLLDGGGFLLDPNTFTIYAGKTSYVLPQNEGKILLALLKNSPNLVSKNELFHTLWGTAEFIDENALQVNFTRLRKTLREIGLEERIETVRGQGYRLKEQVGL